MTDTSFKTISIATDPKILATLHAEQDRQAHTIELIASENFTSEAELSPTTAMVEGPMSCRWGQF